MNKGVKFRAYPNKEQQNLINQTLGCCRLIYNKGLAMRNDAFVNGQKVGYIKAGNSGNDRVLFNRQISGDLNNMVIKIIKVNNYWASAKIIKRPPSKKEQMKENMKLLIKEYNHYAVMHDEETCKHIARLIEQLQKMGE